MKIFRIPPVRLGIALRVFLWCLLALGLAFPFGAGIAWWIADQHARSVIDHELDEDLQSFESDVAKQINDLNALGQWLIEQEDFIDFTKSHDSVKLTKLLEPIPNSNVADFVEVIDSEGIVVGRAKQDEPITPIDDLISEKKAVKALLGQESMGLEEDSAGQLIDISSLPIYDEDHDSPIGTLRLGFYLNLDFLQQSLPRTATDLAIVYRDRFTVNTLLDQYGNPLIGQLANAEIIDAGQRNRPTGLLTIQTERAQYLSKFKPLPFFSRSVKSMFGVAAPTALLEAERLVLLREFGIGILVCLLSILLVGFFSTRFIVHPIKNLTDTIQRMMQGDLSTQVSTRRNDELGDLALQLDKLRQQVDQTCQTDRLEKKRYTAALQSTTVPIVLTDTNQRIDTINPAAEIILRQSQAALIGHPWHSFLVLNDKDEASMPPFWHIGIPGMDGEIGTIIRGRFPLRTQPQIVVEITSTPIQVDGKVVGYAHSLKDASGLDEFERVRDEFLLSVAHELESPLSSWRASLDLLVENYISFSPRDLGVMLRTLQQVTVKFQGLVGRLIDIGKIQAGNFRVRPVSVSLHRLLRDSIGQIEPLLQTKGQQLELQVNCSPSCMVFADPARILQVILNLLKNASKYGPEDQPIVLSTYAQEKFVFFEVIDRGPGIPLEDQKHLFERFYRAKRPEQEGAGLGLGLALAKGIVEAHGGQIGVRSRTNQGMTFWFSLPEAHYSDSNLT